MWHRGGGEHMQPGGWGEGWVGWEWGALFGHGLVMGCLDMKIA
jgi:hypothetical protein